MAACCVPTSCRGLSLGSFIPRTPQQVRAYERALAYCGGFPQENAGEGLGLLFWGGKRTGKTHLATGILMELVANRNISGRFWDFSALVSEIRRSYDKATDTAVVDPLELALDVDILLLDDLASRRIPDWAHNTLFEIIDARHRQRRPTLITTAFDDADRAEVLRADASRRDEFLIERIGARVRSRLLEMCLFVPMQEPRRSDPWRQSSRPSTLAAMRRRG